MRVIVSNQICYAVNPTPSGSQTVTISGTVSAVVFAAFSGVDTSSPFDQQNGFQNCSGSTCPPGSITPSANNELVVSSLCWTDAGNSSIDSGMTIIDQIPLVGGVNYGAVLAYIVQTSAGAINPTWTAPTTTVATTIASFKSGGAAAPNNVPGIINAPIRGGGIRLVASTSLVRTR